MPGQLIRYSPFPMVGACIRSTGLKEISMYSEDELCIRYDGILTKRGPNHVFGWQTRYSDVFGRRTKHSDLSVWLPRLYVRLPGPPTPSEDVVFIFVLLYRSAVGEWKLIGHLTRLKIALASD